MKTKLWDRVPQYVLFQTSLWGKATNSILIVKYQQQGIHLFTVKIDWCVTPGLFSASNFCPRQHRKCYLVLRDLEWSQFNHSSQWGVLGESSLSGLWPLTLKQCQFVTSSQDVALRWRWIVRRSTKKIILYSYIVLVFKELQLYKKESSKARVYLFNVNSNIAFYHPSTCDPSHWQWGM